ncbi:Crp/Fnr family transcriptional regulator [Arsenicibacter rosenii]|uniref:Cyclic nucleotide-binding protein n=1 Tax=Arsenicibacter rosenii TaxID=1750698 RepID=A0A1S2VKL4_9BACT|nr:Crp/Fnr family transcriptional regulator [Arsenicibacter rosenii]OIN59301.1 cyclic nucleotide-binding protein [Arsenicibacter rosenii]
MHQKLLNYFQRIMPLTQEEADAIAATIHIEHVKKGTILLHEGDISAEAYFVLEGCIRQYYLIDGSEKTSNFFTDEQWVVSIKSLNEQVPAAHFLDACVDSYVIVGNRDKEEGLYRQFPKFETISRKIMERVFAEQQEILATYLTETPEQRYLRLMAARPNLFQLVPQYQIASYVGVKPESLSRIRKRILQKH